MDHRTGKNVLVAPDVIGKIFDRKPVSTIRFLAAVVETGRPADSLAAAVFALEYQNGSGKYLTGLFLELDKYDVPEAKSKKCQRERLYELIQLTLPKS